MIFFAHRGDGSPREADGRTNSSLNNGAFPVVKRLLSVKRERRRGREANKYGMHLKLKSEVELRQQDIQLHEVVGLRVDDSCFLSCIDF